MPVALPFVTNRTWSESGYGSLRNSDARAPLSWGVAQVTPSHDPVREGRLDSVERSEATLSLVDFLSDWLDQAIIQGRSPLLYVHGFQYSFAAAATRIADFVACCGDAARLAPLLFTWPSANSLSAYLQDRGTVQASAPALARLLVSLPDAWRACERPPIHLMAHSMGAFALDHVMHHLVDAGELPGERMFSQAVVIAGDTSSGAFAQGGALRALPEIAQWVTIGVNKQDPVLRTIAQVKLRGPRIGCDGPMPARDLPERTAVVDYTIAVAQESLVTPSNDAEWNYVGHNYYRTAPYVREDLARVFSFDTPDVAPELIPGRIRSEAMSPLMHAAPERLYTSHSFGEQKMAMAGPLLSSGAG